MKPADFIEYSEDHYSGLMAREAAEKFIKKHKLEEVKVFYMNDKEEIGILSLNRSFPFFSLWEYPWQWSAKLISRELNKVNTPLIRDNLRFFTKKDEPYPLFILIPGGDKVAVVAPAY